MESLGGSQLGWEAVREAKIQKTCYSQETGGSEDKGLTKYYLQSRRPPDLSTMMSNTQFYAIANSTLSVWNSFLLV